jgi:hypothetical protein
MRKITKKSFLVITILLCCSLIIVAAMVGAYYIAKSSAFTCGGGKTESSDYSNIGAISLMCVDESENEYYKSSAGNIYQMMAAKDSTTPDATLENAHVYPNPYKPGSGGKFDRNTLAFKDLTPQATIRVFNIAGEPVALINKDDVTIDYYDWSAVNDAGKSLASGVYVFYITNPAGEKKTGKFAIIK